MNDDLHMLGRSPAHPDTIRQVEDLREDNYAEASDESVWLENARRHHDAMASMERDFLTQLAEKIAR